MLVVVSLLLQLPERRSSKPGARTQDRGGTLKGEICHDLYKGMKNICDLFVSSVQVFLTCKIHKKVFCRQINKMLCRHILFKIKMYKVSRCLPVKL